jgi:putative redox protein
LTPSKNAHIVWKGNELDFHATGGSGYETDLSGTAGPGGASPMELVLIGLAGCTAMDVISILQKKRQEIAEFAVEITGARAADHPKVYTEFDLLFVFRGRNVDPAAVERAIELSQTKYCSVSAMLQQAAIPIRTTYRIEELL